MAGKAYLSILLVAACNKTPEPAPLRASSAASAAPVESASPFPSGTPVVAAVGKTSYREGKVAKVAGGRVTVEAPADETGRKPSWTLEPAKVWPIAPAPDAKDGEALLCRTAERAWYPCLVVAAGAKATVADAYGARHELGPEDLVRPSDSEAAAIRDYLAGEAVRRGFDEALEKAGPPLRPAGWLPKKNDAVVAHFVKSAWYGATVIEAKGDKARIRWAGDWPERELPVDEIAPLPSRPAAVEVGDLVLARPARPDAAWDVARVAAAAPNLELALRDGGKRSADPKDLVPFAKKSP